LAGYPQRKVYTYYYKLLSARAKIREIYNSIV
jgi:hypothetical protein